ncbi:MULTISPECIES: hypothetical protein [unclassified Coleofasciculus]|nr:MULTISPECIES: hypothetical protein [unclassified Coleofasciculus]
MSNAASSLIVGKSWGDYKLAIVGGQEIMVLTTVADDLIKTENH